MGLRRAFTLLELLVVVAIMGMMAVMSVGGYRAMRRGMQERAVMTNVNQFIRSAYQRAQIDRQPVAVYFWNETLHIASGKDTGTDVAVGKAVAVRRAGRISGVTGSYLSDEFGDLRYNRLVEDEDEEGFSTKQSSGAGIYIYKLSGNESSSPERSVVEETTTRQPQNEPLLLGTGASNDRKYGEVEVYSFKIVDKGGVTWKTGDAYGFEFADLTLPRGYLFSGSYSRNMAAPVAGETVLRFNVGANSGAGASGGTSGADTITVYSFAAGSGGGMTTEAVGTSDSPTKALKAK